MLRYTTDRARPGLVALFDIRPGNGAGQFLQPRSPHAAVEGNNEITNAGHHLQETHLWIMLTDLYQIDLDSVVGINCADANTFLA